MHAFHTGREAKEFLISKIVAEAQNENAPLSEVERKMLYYTESAWTLPDMTEIAEKFDGEYDQSKYEKKIARLIGKAYKQPYKQSSEEYEAWWAAVHFLDKEDHYISVMVRLADIRPRGDQLRLFGTALAIVACFLLAIFFSVKYNIDPSQYGPSRGTLSVCLWAAGVSMLVAYLILRLTVGEKKANGAVVSILEKTVRIYQGRG
jgi:hypothetical protein